MQAVTTAPQGGSKRLRGHVNRPCFTAVCERMSFLKSIWSSLDLSSLSTKDDGFNVTLQPPVGELLSPVAMSEKDFKKEQGERGLQFARKFSTLYTCACSQALGFPRTPATSRQARTLPGFPNACTRTRLCILLAALEISYCVLKIMDWSLIVRF